MSTTPDLSTAADLRAWTADRWQVFSAATDALDDAQWETATDVAGWTVKDHVAHVTRWDESLIALVRDGIPRQQTLEVPDDAWHAGGYDAMNESIRQQTLDTSVAEIRQRRDDVWAELFALLETYDDATIQRPGAEFGLNYGHNQTFLETLVDDLGVHYDQHRQYIERILANGAMSTTEDYRELVEQRWSEFTSFLDGLSEQDWTAWTDASGWTVKDHVSHVVAWDEAWVTQAIGGPHQRVTLGVPEAVWRQGVDAENEHIRAATSHLDAAEVHDRLRARIDTSRAALETLDLLQEARSVGLAAPDDDRLLLGAFIDDQAEHYELHHRYMDRIVDEGRAQAAKQGA